MPETEIFEDRRDAGRRLAAALARFADAHPLILALPRGGVPVAREIAQALDADLDLLFVRKIGAPGNPELGIGAVVDGTEPQLVLNDALIAQIQPDTDYVRREMRRQLDRIKAQREAYRGNDQPFSARGRTVIVVDDGIATGGTARAAHAGLRQAGASRIILAVPVGPQEIIPELEGLYDEVVCLARPEPFRAVGLHYRDFPQVSDAEVIALLGSPPAGES